MPLLYNYAVKLFKKLLKPSSIHVKFERQNPSPNLKATNQNAAKPALNYKCRQQNFRNVAS